MGRPTDEGIFDYIVTSAGSTGCVAAARLSESGRHRVLLLGRGRRTADLVLHRFARQTADGQKSAAISGAEDR